MGDIDFDEIKVNKLYVAHTDISPPLKEVVLLINDLIGRIDQTKLSVYHLHRSNLLAQRNYHDDLGLVK